MKFRTGLALFTRTNDRGLWNVASFHSPHSITWSWILSFRFPKKGQGRWLPFFHSYRGNNGLQWHVAFAKCGIQWQRQNPMWYRDVLNRKRDREDRESYERYLMRSAESQPGAVEEHRTLQ